MAARPVFHPLLVSLVIAATCEAQPAPVASGPPALPPQSSMSLGPIVPFLEATDVFWSMPDAGSREDARPDSDQFEPPYVLEANIFPHLIFRQTYTDVLEVETQASRKADDIKEFAYSISGTPGVRIRMLTSESLPVRTPTFTPRMTFQGLWARGLKEKVRGAMAAERPSVSQPEGAPGDPQAQMSRAPEVVALSRLATIGLYESHVRVAHYSNGQEGCLGLDQIRVGSDQSGCSPAEVDLTRDTINRKNGSFSTNFVAVGVNYSRNTLNGTTDPADSAEHWSAYKEWRLGLELERHFANSRIRDYYSQWRLNGTAGFAWKNLAFCDRRFDVSATGTAGLGARDGISNNSIAIQATCFPVNRGGWGFFARYALGQDYYNVQMFETINRLQFGLTYNQNGFFSFRSRPPEATAPRRRR